MKVRDKRSVFIVEPVRHGRTHQPFNSSLLLTAHAAFPNHQIVVLAFRDHLAALHEAIGTPEWLIPEELAPDHDVNQSSFVKVLQLADLIRREAVELEADHLIFASVTPRLLFAYRLVGFMRERPESVMAVFHAGLAAMVRPRRLSGIQKLSSSRTAILASEKGMRFAVLEPAILAELGRRDKRLAQRFSVFPHPLPPDLLECPADMVCRSAPDNPVRIALLGLATPQKGLMNFLTLAREAQDRFPGEFQFELIGRLHEDYRHLVPDVEAITGSPVPEEVLPRDVFLQRLRNIDFALFLFQGNHYELTASGVLIDCMALGIPVISTKNGLIEQMCNEVGAIGIELELLEAGSLIEQIRESIRISDYSGFREHLHALRDGRRPEKLAGILQGILCNFEEQSGSRQLYER